MKEILNVIHNTIYQFVCGDYKEVPMSDKDELLLEVNKAICNNLKALEQQPCEDCVSRQAVIDLVTAECVDLQDGSEEWRSYVNDTVESIYLKVKKMPSVILKIESEDK